MSNYSKVPEFSRRSRGGHPAPDLRTSSPHPSAGRNRKAGTAASLLQLAFLGAILLLGSGLVLRLLADQKIDFIETNGRIVAAANSIPVITGPQIDKTKLDRQINNLIDQYSSLNVSVSYRDLTFGRAFHYGTSDSFEAASVSKLLTAAYYLKQVDEGKRSLNDIVGGASARSQLRNLIVVSDNTAWVVLDRTLGAGNLEGFAREVGMKKYRHSGNTISSEDVTLLLQKIYRGNLLSQDSSELLLSYMEAANYRQYIVAALPDGVTSYHKVGFLEDRIHDAAIVDNGRYPYILVIFTEAKSSFNFTSATNLIHQITDIVNQPYVRR